MTKAHTMAKTDTNSTRSPRGTKPVSAAFFSALDSAPEAQRIAIARAAQVMIRDELRMRRERTKAVTMKARAATKTTATKTAAKSALPKAASKSAPAKASKAGTSKAKTPAAKTSKASRAATTPVEAAAKAMKPVRATKVRRPSKATAATAE